MNKKLGFTKIKTVFFIFSLIILLGGYVAFKYYNANHSKDIISPPETSKDVTSTQGNQLQETTKEEPKNPDSQGTTKEPETAKPQENTTQDNNKKLTSEKAVEIIKNIVIKNKPNLKVNFDHIQKRDGNDYYVIRLYESMPDHSATLGWFYVQVNTGKAFQWDLTSDKLTPIN